LTTSNAIEPIALHERISATVPSTPGASDGWHRVQTSFSCCAIVSQPMWRRQEKTRLFDQTRGDLGRSMIYMAISSSPLV
jgi:hypothetical protein